MVKPELNRILRYSDAKRMYYETGKAGCSRISSNDDQRLEEDLERDGNNDLPTTAGLCDCQYEDPLSKEVSDQDSNAVRVQRVIPPPCPKLWSAMSVDDDSNGFHVDTFMLKGDKGNNNDQKSPALNGDERGAFTFSCPNNGGGNHHSQSDADLSLEPFSLRVMNVHYVEEGSETEIQKLDFLCLGHPTFALDHFRLEYANSVKEVVFRGHFNHVSPAFQILSQLPLVEKIAFVLGPTQLPFMVEMREEGQALVCQKINSVRFLEVSLDPAGIPNMSDEADLIMKFILKRIFKLSAKLLPNLQAVKATSPAGFMEGLRFLQKIVFNSQFQEDFHISGTALPGELCLMQIDFRMNPNGNITVPILRKVKTPDFEPKDNMNHTLEGIYYQLERLSEALSEFKMGGTAQKILLNSFTRSMRSFLFNPPEPFLACFTAKELFRLHKCPSQINDGRPDPPTFPNPILRATDQIIQDLDTVWRRAEEFRERIDGHLPSGFFGTVESYIRGEAMTRL